MLFTVTKPDIQTAMNFSIEYVYMAKAFKKESFKVPFETCCFVN